jgi:hypothetical protein
LRINHSLRLWYFLAPWKEAKFIILPELGKDTKFPQNLGQINFLSTTGKLFEKLILRKIQRQIEKKNLLEASQVGFTAYDSTTFEIMRLTDHATLHFNNMSTATVFWTSRKPLTQHGTPVPYTNCQN